MVKRLTIKVYAKDWKTFRRYFKPMKDESQTKYFERFVDLYVDLEQTLSITK